MIITTTNSIDRASVQKYLGLVVSNLVIGTNVFSDFIASFSDFFGGMSGQYRNQLTQLYERAVEDLTQKAALKGANAILGTRLDFDEISGKGKSMFMVSISGTAVKCQFGTDSILDDNYETEKLITDEDVKKAQFLMKWRDSDKNTVYQSDWDFISNNDLPEIAVDLLLRRLMCYTPEEYDSKLIAYLNKIDYETKLKAVYEAYSQLDNFTQVSQPETDSFFYKLIQHYCLFSPQYVTTLLKKGKLSFAISLLKTNKPYYSKADLDEMDSHILFFDSLPDMGVIKEVKASAFSSSTKQVYVCQNGHENHITSEYCERYTCGCNIKGLDREQVQTINAYKERVSALKELL